MHIQTARSILGFPAGNVRKLPARNKTHPKYVIRCAPTTKLSKQKQKKTKKHIEHQVKPIQNTRYKYTSTFEAELDQIEGNFIQRQLYQPTLFHSHRLIREIQAPLLENQKFAQSSQLQNNQHNNSKTIHYPRISHTDHQIKLPKQQKQQIIMRSHGHVLKHPTIKGGIEQRHVSKVIADEPKVQKYYVSDVKKSVREYLSNRQYVSPYLSHFMDSISTFDINVHAFPPKDPKMVDLPNSDGKITIAFDLDETLLHTQNITEYNSSSSSADWGSLVQICTQNDGDYCINVKIRPYAYQVLERLKSKFELGIFTASQEEYGNAVLKVLDPEGKLFSFRLFRQHCYEMHSRVNLIKDLRTLNKRDLSRIILIDNSPQAYLFQKSNGIPIIPFYNDTDDNELLKLEVFLNKISDVKDVRPILKDFFKFDQYQNKNMFRLVKQLYSH